MEMVVFKKEPTERNPQCVVIAMIVGDNWGTFMRIFKHKGIDTNPICRRPMIEKEIEAYKKMWRLWHGAYKKWENLIADEYEFTGDIGWCKKLIKHAGIKGSSKLPKELFT